MKTIDFDFILLDGKLYENISIYDISYETLVAVKLLHIGVNKVDAFIMMELDVCYFLDLKTMMQFTIRLDML